MVIANHFVASGREQPSASPPSLPLSSGSAAGRIHTVQPATRSTASARRYGVAGGALAAGQRHRQPGPDPGRREAHPAGSPATVAAPDGARRPPRPGRRWRRRPRPRRSQGHALVQVPAARAGLRPLFAQYARLAGVPADLAMALAWQESGWQTQQGVVDPGGGGHAADARHRRVRVAGSCCGTVGPSTRGTRWPTSGWAPGSCATCSTATAATSTRALASYYQGLRSVRERGLCPRRTGSWPTSRRCGAGSERRPRL